MDSNNLGSALVNGVMLAIIGIGLFLFLYFVVFANQAAVIRLFASLLLPPAIMGVVVGGIYLARQSKD